jgi:hypothetical protein
MLTTRCDQTPGQVFPEPGPKPPTPNLELVRKTCVIMIFLGRGYARGAGILASRVQPGPAGPGHTRDLRVYPRPGYTMNSGYTRDRVYVGPGPGYTHDAGGHEARVSHLANLGPGSRRVQNGLCIRFTADPNLHGHV